MRAVYSPRYEFSLPGHVWPTAKYRLIVEQLRGAVDLVPPSPASWDDLALVHTAEYLDKLRSHRLTLGDLVTLELPWTPELADAFRLMVGGTCDAARLALDEGRAAHVGGGLHHAYAEHGEGFCPFNDIAVAIRVLQRDGKIARAAVVDCDVHHGNGTAAIFAHDPAVFTFSIHQQHNYPAHKPASSLDIGLEDGAGDARYLAALRGALPQVIGSRPDLLVYVAGADPFEKDRLGALALTKEGLAERDEEVVAAAHAAGIPLALVLAGGYAADVADTVDIQAATVRALLR
ncbi:MAG: histone deacetylase [Acidobacteria bacterium]|nr:histone deacetylase [Acidobacteriota bacterium]